MFCEYLNMFYLGIHFLSVAAYDRGYVNSPCPDLKPVKNFNFSAYASGKWYEIARYSNDWIGRGDCVYMDHQHEGNNYTFTISDVIHHKLASVGGSIQPQSPQDINTGHVVYIGDFYKASEGAVEVDVNILSIDYDSFCIVHHCKHDSEKRFHHEFIWILSRFQELTKESKNIIDAFLSSSVIDQRQLIWDHFSKEYCDIQ